MGLPFQGSSRPRVHHRQKLPGERGQKTTYTPTRPIRKPSHKSPPTAQYLTTSHPISPPRTMPIPTMCYTTTPNSVRLSLGSFLKASANARHLNKIRPTNARNLTRIRTTNRSRHQKDGSAGTSTKEERGTETGTFAQKVGYRCARAAAAHIPCTYIIHGKGDKSKSKDKSTAKKCSISISDHQIFRNHTITTPRSLETTGRSPGPPQSTLSLFHIHTTTGRSPGLPSVSFGIGYT
jgi:hypothetical protein